MGVPRKTFDDMGQVLFHVAFRNAEHLGQLVRRQPAAEKQIHHALARGAFDERHNANMLRESVRAMQNLSGWPTK
jgi:hypothetical protein